MTNSIAQKRSAHVARSAALVSRSDERYCGGTWLIARADFAAPIPTMARFETKHAWRPQEVPR